MSFLNFIFIVLFSANILFAKNSYNVSVDSSQVLGQILAIEKFDNYTFVLGFGKEMIQQKSKNMYSAKLSYFNGEKWQNISNFANYNGVNIPIAINFQSRIAFDSLGNIWVTGAYLYKYSAGKWTIYNYNDLLENYRIYEDICVDLNNNVWVSTKIQLYDTLILKYKNISSELFKFHNEKFEIVYINSNAYALSPKSDDTYGSTLTSLNNGDVVISSNDFLKSQVLFFNSQGLYDSIIVAVNDDIIDSTYRNESRAISQINMIENEIYFALNSYKYFSSIDKIDKSCCSGLSSFRNKKWKLFDENNNLKKFSNNNSYFPVHRIYKFQNKIIALINTKMCLLENNKFYELKWENILQNSILIPSNAEYNKSEYLNDFIDRLINSFTSQNIQLSDVVENKNKLWLQTLAGVFIIDISTLTDLGESKITISNSYIYPNITNEYFEFYNTESNSIYNIYNLMGILLVSGSTIEKKVETLGLPIGTYIVEVINKNNIQTHLLIKIN